MTDNETDTTAAELVAVLRQLAEVLDRVDAAGSGQASTPCTEYDVSRLRSHVVGWVTAFTDGFTDPGGRCSDPEQVTVQGSGSAQVRAAADRLEALDSAALPEQLMIGEAGMPTSMALPMILWEYQMHGWDLAAADGQPWSPDERGVEASLQFAPMMLTDEYQGEGKTFGPRVDVADDAPPLDRLLGLSGRNPEWSAP